MKIRVIALAGVLLAAGCSAPAPPAAPDPSVFVSIARPQQGSLPDLLTAYGSAIPSLDGSQTLSVPQAGQVSRLATTPGAAVRAGQVLIVFTVDPASLAAYRQAVGAVSAAQKQRATTAQLLQQQLATRDQLTQAEKAVSDAVAALDAMRQAGDGQAVRTLLAPFDGTITAVSVAQGDRTAPGASLITIAKRSGIVVTVGIDPAVRATVRAGQAVVIERLSGGAAFSGRVLRVDRALNPKTRQVDVDLGFPDGALLPGEALRVGIRVGDVAGWIVPHRAVVTANGDARIYQIAGAKAAAVKVTVTLATPQGDVVQGPLDPNRRIIVDGAYQVEDGSAVRWVGR